MKRNAVIIEEGSKYAICCDIELLQDFFKYVMADDRHRSEIKLIFGQVIEGHKTMKVGDEPYGTKAMKPFKNGLNDRIICNVTSRPNQKKCIVMSEIYFHKSTNSVGKTLDSRYKIVSKYEYEIIK